MPHLSPRHVFVALVLCVTVASLPSAAAASGTAAETAGVTAAAPRAGLQLLPAGGNSEWMAPQLSSALYLTVQGSIAHGQLLQSFDNPSNETVDAIYHFPLPVSAAVKDFELHVGDRVLRGLLREGEQAGDLYETTRQALTKVSLLQWQKPHWLSLNIANIGPGETVEVSLKFQQEVRHDNDTYFLAFPVTQAPSDDESSVRSMAATVGDGPWLHAEVTFDPPNTVSNVRSPSHALDTISQADGSTRVRLRYGPLIADRHFHLQWEQQTRPDRSPRFQEERFAGEHYALLEVSAPTQETASSWRGQPLDVFFVLDATASMRGAALSQARYSLQLGLDDLAPEDTFNVVTFGEATRLLFSHARLATPGNLRLARDLGQHLRARGHDPLLAALQMALPSRTPIAKDSTVKPSRLRRVVLLTDGGTGANEEVLRFVEKHRFEQSLFTVGLGGSSSLSFTANSSRLGQGEFLHAATLDALDEALPSLLDKLQPPAFEQVQIVFEGAPHAELFPDALGPLPVGAHRLVIAQLKADNNGARLRGRLPSGRWQQYSRAAADSQATHGLHQLWAQRKLQSAAEELLRQHRPASAQQEVQLQKLAQKHGLLSRYTSWIAIDTQPSVSRLGRSVSVPLAAAAGPPATTPPEFEQNQEPTCMLGD